MEIFFRVYLRAMVAKEEHLTSSPVTDARSAKSPPILGQEIKVNYAFGKEGALL